MIVDSEIQEVKEVVANAKSAYVLMGSNPSTDVVAGALGLYLALEEKGIGTFVVCETPMRVEWSKLVGLDRVGEKLGNKNLVVSFDYKEEMVDKVSFDGANERFNLVVMPKAGQKPPDSASVSFSYSGASADVVFVMGVNSFSSLGSIYNAEPKLFTEAVTVRIDNREAMPFTKRNLIDMSASGVSEVVAKMLESVGLTLNGDIANNLMAGIDAATDRFGRDNLGAETFKVAAHLLEKGAKRLSNVAEVNSGSMMMEPMSQADSAKTAPVNTSDNDNLGVVQKNPIDKPPKEWTEPRIYSGSTKV